MPAAPRRDRAARAIAVVLVILTTTLAAADAARARKTLEDRLVPLTPTELLQRAARDDVELDTCFVQRAKDTCVVRAGRSGPAEHEGHASFW